MKALIGASVAVLLAVFIYLANVAWWIDSEIVQSDTFVASSVEALGQDSSRDAMARLIVDRLVDEYPLLIILDSSLVSLFSDLLDSPALEDILVLVSADIHDRMMTGNQEVIVVDLLEFRDVILGPVEAAAPRLAALIPDSWFTSIVVLEAGALPDLSAVAKLVGPVKIVSMVGIVILVAFILWYLRRRGAGLIAIGASCGIAALGTAILVPGGKAMTLMGVDQTALEVIVADTYDQFTNSLKLSSLVLVVIAVGISATGYVLWVADDDSDRTVR